MILILRKEMLILTAVALIAIAFTTFGLVTGDNPPTIHVTSNIPKNKIVILDAGHGGKIRSRR